MATITGTEGVDNLFGTGDNDRITGTDSTARGSGAVDKLTGGGGANKFILGNRNGAYYLGNGGNDYATITDFNLFRDSIDVGSLRNYSFALEGNGTVNLFAGKDVNNRDPIAKIQIGNFGQGLSSKGSNSVMGMKDGGSGMLAMNNLDTLSSQLNILSGDLSTADAVM